MLPRWVPTFLSSMDPDRGCLHRVCLYTGCLCRGCFYRGGLYWGCLYCGCLHWGWLYRSSKRMDSLFNSNHSCNSNSGSSRSQLKRFVSERQKFSRAPKCPVPKNKVFYPVYLRKFNALPPPYNFFAAYLGCINKVVDGIMCLEIFQNSFWTASGEPLARSFAEKIVTPKSYFSFFTKKGKVRFECFCKEPW